MSETHKFSKILEAISEFLAPE